MNQDWQKAPNPMILASACLLAIGDLDAVTPARPSGNALLFKTRLLREIRLRMTAFQTALSDDTVSALLMLTSFEVRGGSF